MRPERQWPIIFLLLFSVLRCIPYIKKIDNERSIRVAVVAAANAVRITGLQANKLYRDRQFITSSEFPSYFNPHNGLVVVNGLPYRGSLEIRNNDGKIWVINILAIEDYLKGVVPCEIGPITDVLIEAAKAQAVAARTYAYAHLNQYHGLGFDLYADVRDQVYMGVTAENPRIDRAVEMTAGEILVFEGRPIDAKYHSTCGGRTADFNDAWTGEEPVYLRSVECPYCQGSPYYRWTKKIAKNDFFENLRSRLSGIGINLADGELIESFRLIKNPHSGRVNVIFLHTNHDEYRIAHYNIRKVFGDVSDPDNLLRSSYIDLSAEGDTLVIEGRGYGHGVGMCQFGAMELARMGKGYKEILRYYYPGTKLVRRR